MGTLSDDYANLKLAEIAANAWVSLHFDSPVIGGAGKNEISGGGYHRVKATMTAPTNRAIWSTSPISFTGLNQTTVAYFGVWTAASGGTLIAYGQLPTVSNIGNGGGYVITAGNLGIAFA